MRIFVAGATGALGQPLVRGLVQKGYEVIGLTRSSAKRSLLESMGARAAVADALNAGDLERVIKEAAPTQVVHLLTALPAEGALRAKSLRPTNLIRIQGTANLLKASVSAGVRRIVAESFVGVYGTVGFDTPRSEDEPLPAPGGGTLLETILALRNMEEQLMEARRSGQIETVVLRYALFYGPHVPSTEAVIQRLRNGQVYIPRDARGLASFIHIDDAASATIAAIECEKPSPVYNIADNEPIRIGSFLNLAALTFGTPQPKPAPYLIVKLVAPVIAAGLTTRLPLSNAKARRELGWKPAYPTVQEGLEQTASALRKTA